MKAADFHFIFNPDFMILRIIDYNKSHLYKTKMMKYRSKYDIVSLAPFSLLMAEEIEEIKVTGSYIGTRANDIGTEIIDQLFQ